MVRNWIIQTLGSQSYLVAVYIFPLPLLPLPPCPPLPVSNLRGREGDTPPGDGRGGVMETVVQVVVAATEGERVVEAKLRLHGLLVLVLVLVVVVVAQTPLVPLFLFCCV